MGHEQSKLFKRQPCTLNYKYDDHVYYEFYNVGYSIEIWPKINDWILKTLAFPRNDFNKSSLKRFRLRYTIYSIF